MVIESPNRRYRYTVLSPGGNDTALVLGDDFTEKERVEINNEIMSAHANVEQVGFLSSDSYKLTMAGGEFCGNAVRCAAFHYLGGKPGELQVEICEEKIRAGIYENGGVWVEVPRASCTEIAEGIFLCKMNGINHIVVTEENKEALGVIFCNSGKINPIVYVPAAGTCVNETACLSGSAAAFSAINAEADAGNPTYMSFLQPSGKTLDVSAKSGSAAILVSGEVTEIGAC